MLFVLVVVRVLGEGGGYCLDYIISLLFSFLTTLTRGHISRSVDAGLADFKRLECPTVQARSSQARSDEGAEDAGGPHPHTGHGVAATRPEYITPTRGT